MTLFFLECKNLNQLEKTLFLHGEFTSNTEIFKVLEIKGYTRAVAGCCDNTFAAGANFLCLDNRTNCIGDCSLEWFSSMCPWWVMMVVQYAIFTARKRSLGQGNIFTGGRSLPDRPPRTDTSPGQKTPPDRDPCTETPCTENPLDREPSGQKPLWTTPPPIWTETSLNRDTRYGKERVVRILLECILVMSKKTKETGKMQGFYLYPGLVTLAYLFAICSCNCQGIFHESLHSSHGVISEL